MSELEPCPFCNNPFEYLRGSGLDLNTQDNNPKYGCRVCRYFVPLSVPRSRPIEDALRAEVERLKAEGMKALQAAAETGELAMNLTAEVEVRGDQVSALMEQVAHYMGEAQELRAELHQVRMNWDAALKAELAKRDDPLTDEQAAMVQPEFPSQAKHWDAAIRAAREGE